MKLFRNISEHFDRIDLNSLKGNSFLFIENKLEFPSTDLTSIHSFSFQKSGEVWESAKTSPFTVVIIIMMVIVFLIYYKTSFQKNMPEDKTSLGKGNLKEVNRNIPDHLKVSNTPKEISGDKKLNIRQQEVLNLVLEGLSNKSIGEQLFISPNTVKYHLRNIYRYYGVSSRVELFAKLADLSENNTDPNQEQQFSDMSWG